MLIKKLLATCLCLWAATSVWAQTANVQVIHNSADPAAAVVDIYINGGTDPAIDDLAFRDATPFLELPAEVDVTVGVAPGNSTGPADVLADFSLGSLAADENYVVMATGVLDPTQFDETANPGEIGFTLEVLAPARTSATGSDVDIVAYHGSTDAPTVDVLANGGPLVDDLSYGDFSGYLSVPAAAYTLDVTPGDDNATVVASFEADLSGLGGGSAVVFASGFLDPSANQDGEAFGLFAALADGTVVAFPAATEPATASVQVIHNSADPAASTVDVYLNGELAVDDFAFRTATSFLNLPAEEEIVIGIAPGSSADASEVIAEFPVTLAADETYVVVATGVLDPASFDSSVNSDIGFTLEILTPARTSGTDDNVDFVAYHGATDAPAVDVLANNGGPLLSGLTYGTFSDYLSVPAASYVLSVTPAGANETIVASFLADLSGLGGGSAVVFASGFLDPSANQEGEGFGLFAALADGTVVAFPALDCSGIISFSLVDADADTVISAYDPIMDGAEINLDELPENLNLIANLCEGFSTGSVRFTLDGANQRSQLENLMPYALYGDINGDFEPWIPAPMPGETYTLMAEAFTGQNGSGMASDPFSISFSFTGTVSQVAQVQVIHNSADPAAALVDIYLNGELAVDDFAFRTATPFLDLPAEEEIVIGVAPGTSTGTDDILAEFPVTLAADETYVVMATGVLDPTTFDNSVNSDIAFTLEILTPARTSATGSNVDFVAYHGATDAPTVDVLANGGVLVDDISYSEFSSYFSVPAAVYTLDVTPGSDNATVVASFTADLSGLGGGSAVVFASGFLDPTANQDGAAFGLFAALADGTVVAFPAASSDCSLEIESFSLIDPVTNMVVPGYEVLEDGAVLDLGSLPTQAPSIRANVCEETEIQSVIFELTGDQEFGRIENVMPYSLFGDIEGDYNEWYDDPQPGESFTVTATGNDQILGMGASGTPKSISFSFINSAERAAQFGSMYNGGARMNVFPNPSTGRVRLRLNHEQRSENATLYIFSSTGQRLMEKPITENSLTELNLQGFTPGMYILKVVASDYVQQQRLLIAPR